MITSVITEENPFEVELDSHFIVAAMLRDASGMVEDAYTLVVDSDSAYKDITALYSRAKEWKKEVEDIRKKLIAPWRAKVAEVNDRAKELTDPLDQVIAIANSKANGYVQQLEAQKAKEDERMRLAAALFDEEPGYIEPMASTLRGSGAMAVSKKEKCFRLLDIAKVPAKYLVVDESAVKKDLALGIAEIPGLEIYEETKTSLRLR